MLSPHIIAVAILVSLCLAASDRAGAADEIRTITKRAAYEDVQTDVLDAIIARGLKADQVGNTAAMLERTEGAVGATKPVYKAASVVAFCSARIAHAFVKANPANIASCPSQIFLYETAAEPGIVVVGYRRPFAASDPQSQAAAAALTQLLDAILAEVEK
jgi:Domain of unknown function DUF302